MELVACKRVKAVLPKSKVRKDKVYNPKTKMLVVRQMSPQKKIMAKVVRNIRMVLLAAITI